MNLHDIAGHTRIVCLWVLKKAKGSMPFHRCWGDECQGIRKGTGSKRIVWAPTGSLFFFLTNFLYLFVFGTILVTMTTTTNDGEIGMANDKGSLQILFTYSCQVLTNFYICF